MESEFTLSEIIEFENALKNSIKSYTPTTPNQIVSGRIVGISKETIMVNVNGKSSIAISCKTDKAASSIIEHLVVGDDIDVYVKEDGKGNLIGTLDGVSKELTRLDLIKSIAENNISFDCTITEHVNGGFMGDVNGMVVFLPGSLAAPNKIEDFGKMVGTKLKVMPVVFDTKKSAFVVSHKKWLKTNMEELVKNLDFETEYTGKITGVTDFGIFVEFEKHFTGLISGAEFENFEKRLYENQTHIDFWIKEITDEFKLILTVISPKVRREALQKRLDSFGV
jgi:ribosomal protein S1